ncbi:uncharacterized protein LOC144871031 [Branchiostoma floridae x Branchiostoma japonicum]|uniref:Uncharacterized protein n=1 Tax=Branchiostoma floridae TaxID=7739 RepID=C3Y0I2_BRAFL|eukprot:XP_002610245.1 hypothetical protein BRAFLDRAFT_92965 [Branchiostoma floridae]
MAASQLYTCLSVCVLLISGVSAGIWITDITNCALLCLGCNELHKGTLLWEARGGGELCVNFCTQSIPSLVPRDFCHFILESGEKKRSSFKARYLYRHRTQ